MTILRCPNCKSPLHPSGKTLQCLQGHTFDVAKQGYTNLLLANKKKSNKGGDSRTMVEAREAFLVAGHYDGLVAMISSRLQDLGLPAGSVLLDIGCGTGYYTRKIAKAHNLQSLGIDISKIAVAKASAQDQSATYLVASAFDLPVADACVNLVLNVFSPVELDEVTRVLSVDGYFLKVIPLGHHMKEVAELVYDTFVPHSSTIAEDIATAPGLELVDELKLEQRLSLTADQLRQLVSMTPYLYKFTAEQLERLKPLDVTISFAALIGRKEEK